MNDIVIKAEHLGKKYVIGHQASDERYTALRDVVMNNARSLWHKTKNLVQGNSVSGRNTTEEIWALQDVSFEIQRGEVVGIIGRNGAGKSTLLKILSRITEPSAGRVTIKGRVASLLEVGTGFHPELSGRENIYLNGAILGMTRQEIRRKFDEIVDFAEVEKFLDTPVKRYSSGMYVRLAFAVAAHLEPEILLIDEVLAVGDAAFQSKSLGKMKDVATGGRTVFFVSHNMAAILGLCSRSILLTHGRVLYQGNTVNTVEQYLQTLSSSATITLGERLDRKGNQQLKFETFELRNSDNQPTASVHAGQDILLAFRYSAQQGARLRDVHLAIGVHGRFDENLFHLSTDTSNHNFREIPASGEILCQIPRLPIQPGSYSFNLFCTVGGEVADWIQNAGVIEVEAGDFFGSGRLPPADQGSFIVQHSWSLH